MDSGSKAVQNMKLPQALKCHFMIAKQSNSLLVRNVATHLIMRTIKVRETVFKTPGLQGLDNNN